MTSAQRTASDPAAQIRSIRQFCETYTPKRHAAGTCRCEPAPGPLVIQPRTGRRIRVI